MKLLRASAVAAAIFVLAPPPPASAQISPNAVWSCEFTNSPTDCGLFLQAFASNRATIVSPGRDGPTAVQLITEPGDINIAGSGANERTDLTLSTSSTYRSEEHTSELQSQSNLVCRLLLEKKNTKASPS